MSDLGDLTRFARHNYPCSTDESHMIKTIQSYSETALEEINKREAHLQQLLKGMNDEESNLIQTITHCHMALSPHRNLHDKILRHIFSILSMDHGPVLFPLSRNETVPPQLTVPNVCHKWRKVTQSMGELWNNIDISDVHDARSRRLWQRWLIRAGGRPVTLGIDLTSMSASDTENMFLGIILGIHVKQLSVQLYWFQFSELKEVPAEAFSTLKDVRISLKENQIYRNRPLHDSELPRFAQKTSGFYSKLTTRELDVLSRAEFPWSQIRYLKNIHFDSPTTAFRLLEQVPLLEELGLTISILDRNHSDDESLSLLQTLTLHHLRILTLDLTRVESMAVSLHLLQHLKCPNIVELDVELPHHSNIRTYQLLKQNYNLCRLEEFSIGSRLGSQVPVSVILMDAPMLRHIFLPDVIWDDEAFIGLSTGVLGRSLLSISLSYSKLDLDEILKMISKRQKNARLMNQNARSWKEEITSLKAVHFRGSNLSDIIKERAVRTLEGLGLKVVFNVHPTIFKREREHNVPYLT